jgi:hypothetical protein
MGIFDIFKSSDQKKLDNYIKEFKKKAFPNGRQQIEEEVNQVSALFLFKYSHKEIENIYLHATSMYYILDKDEEKILKSILVNNTNISSQNASIIFQFIHQKFATKRENIKDSNNFSDSERLLLICKGGIVELKKVYKELTPNGKFEVILFNSVIALNTYKNKYLGDNSAVEDEFIKLLLNQASKYEIDFPSEKVLELLVERFEVYLDEINNIYIGSDPIVSKILFNFYIRHLNSDDRKSFDIGNEENLKSGINNMVKWVHENTRKI